MSHQPQRTASAIDMSSALTRHRAVSPPNETYRITVPFLAEVDFIRNDVQIPFNVSRSHLFKKQIDDNKLMLVQIYNVRNYPVQERIFFRVISGAQLQNSILEQFVTIDDDTEERITTVIETNLNVVLRDPSPEPNERLRQLSASLAMSSNDQQYIEDYFNIFDLAVYEFGQVADANLNRFNDVENDSGELEQSAMSVIEAFREMGLDINETHEEIVQVHYVEEFRTSIQERPRRIQSTIEELRQTIRTLRTANETLTQQLNSARDEARRALEIVRNNMSRFIPSERRISPVRDRNTIQSEVFIIPPESSRTGRYSPVRRSPE
jgi:hypothetical protein